MRALQCSMLAKAEYRRPVLDLGCGEGLFASILFKDPVDIGVDINFKETVKAQKTKAYRQILVSDGASMPVAGNSVNTVCSNCVLEHLPNAEDVLSEVNRVLKKGGEFVCTIADKSFTSLLFYSTFFDIIGLRKISRRYAGFYDNFFKHHQLLTKEQWEILLKKSGFEIVTSEYYFAPRAIQVYDLLLPFSLPAFINKKLFGRWIISPSLRRKFMVGFGKKILNRYYRMQAKTGGELFIRAVKS